MDELTRAKLARVSELQVTIARAEQEIVSIFEGKEMPERDGEADFFPGVVMRPVKSAESEEVREPFRGGGAGMHRGPRKCSGCGKPGHTYRTCPSRGGSHSSSEEESEKEEGGAEQEEASSGVFFSKGGNGRGEKLTPGQFASVKESQRHGMTSKEIAENLEADIQEVNAAMGLGSYYFYEKDYRSVKL